MDNGSDSTGPHTPDPFVSNFQLLLVNLEIVIFQLLVTPGQRVLQYLADIFEALIQVFLQVAIYESVYLAS